MATEANVTIDKLPAADREEALRFLAKYPEAGGIDVVMTDCHGIGRGKIIRRHELESLFVTGRGMPMSLFGQDVAGDDVESTGLVLVDGGGDKRCWPVTGTLGFMPHTGRGHVLVTMREPDGGACDVDPRSALSGQVEKAARLGYLPVGAFELEFYLVDNKRDADGRPRPAAYPLTGSSPHARNTMSVDELDQIFPLFELVYEGAAHLGLTLEAVISEYGIGQYELTLRHRDLLRAADDVVTAKRLIRSAARRLGFEACFMAKPFGHQAGSGMHLHLSLCNAEGRNLYGDRPGGELSDLLLHSIGGVRATMGETMLVLAPFLNSWRRFATKVYSPASDSWGIEDRTVAIRVPAAAGQERHFEHRVAGVDSNPYLVAAVTLGGAMHGIGAGMDPGVPLLERAGTPGREGAMPRNWLEAIERLRDSDFAKLVLGKRLHRAFVEVKLAEWKRLALEVSEAEWQLYGFVV